MAHTLLWVHGSFVVVDSLQVYGMKWQSVYQNFHCFNVETITCYLNTRDILHTYTYTRIQRYHKDYRKTGNVSCRQCESCLEVLQTGVLTQTDWLTRFRTWWLSTSKTGAREGLGTSSRSRVESRIVHILLLGSDEQGNSDRLKSYLFSIFKKTSPKRLLRNIQWTTCRVEI